jgi:hypothetical protein
MSCILRITGTNLDPDSLQRAMGLRPYQTTHKGERRFPTSTRNKSVFETSGLFFNVSDAEFQEFDLQIQDAIQFLRANAQALSAIKQFKDIENAFLDFGIEWRNVAVQGDYMPPELLQLAGSLGLGIVLSHYPISSESDDESA